MYFRAQETGNTAKTVISYGLEGVHAIGQTRLCNISKLPLSHRLPGVINFIIIILDLCHILLLSQDTWIQVSYSGSLVRVILNNLGFLTSKSALHGPICFMDTALPSSLCAAAENFYLALDQGPRPDPSNTVKRVILQTLKAIRT